MKLDRDINSDGKGKYALLNLRKLPGGLLTQEELCAAIMAHPDAVEFGAAGSEGEFFVIKLKDKYAQDALVAYAEAASWDDSEYAASIAEMSLRSGADSPFCKTPD